MQLTDLNNLDGITKRTCIDIGHPCDQRCKMCWHRFEDRKTRKWLPADEIKRRLDRAKDQFDLQVCDITGGEPSLNKDLPELTEHAAAKGIPLCPILNGLCGPDYIRRLQDAGAAEFVISIHGTKSAQAATMDRPEDEDRIWDTINETIRAITVPWRNNSVMTPLTAETLADLCDHLQSLPHPPTCHNVLNFCPTGLWQIADNQAHTQAMMLRHDVAEQYIRAFVERVEHHKIWTNLRYFPFCAYKGLEQYMTNYAQINYDEFEWDIRSFLNMTDQNIIQLWFEAAQSGVWAESFPHAFFNFWGVRNSVRLGQRYPECEQCALVNICDGTNGPYARHFPQWKPQPYSGDIVDDPRYFRRQVKSSQKAETKTVTKRKKAKSRKRPSRSATPR